MSTTRTPDSLVGLFWLAVACGLIVIGGFPVLAPGLCRACADTPLPMRLALVGGGGATLLLALALLSQRQWARPAAIIYGIWLGGLLLLLLLPGSRLNTGDARLLSRLPHWVSPTSWIALLRLLLLVTAATAFALSHYLSRTQLWRAPRRMRGPSICRTCGASEMRAASGTSSCVYCGATMRHLYFLQPVLRNARRILLLFEPGHERIRIGRAVGNGEAWIDIAENKRYRTISRHHADIELDFQTGRMTLYKAFTSQPVSVDGHAVLMSAPVQLGSLIQLGKVQFVLGNSAYEPTLAYFVDQADQQKRRLLRFNGLNNQQTIGQAGDNDVVLAMPDIAYHHATILFDPNSQMFFIRNEAARSPVYIDGHLLEPGRTTQLSNDELIIVQLGAHNFNFLPVLYQPTRSGNGFQTDAFPQTHGGLEEVSHV